MNYNEFAEKIKAKYPGSYDDMDNRTLASKMVQKYPEYNDITFDAPSGGSSVMDTVKGAASLAAEFEQKANPVGVLKAVDTGLDKLGEKTESYLTEKGHPTIGKVAGYGISHVPEVVGAAQLAASAPAMAKGAFNLAKGGISKVTDKLLGPGLKEAEIHADEVLTAAEDKIVMLQEKLKNLPSALAARAKELKKLQQQAGAAMGKAEEAGNFAMKEIPEGFTDIIKDPKKAEKFGNLMGRIADKTPEELLKEMDVKSIQLVRKLAETHAKMGVELPGVLQSNIARGREAAANALAHTDEGFAAARSRFLDVKNAIDDLATQKAVKSAEYKIGIDKARQSLRELKREVSMLKKAGASRDKTRKIVGYTAAGLAGLPILRGFMQ